MLHRRLVRLIVAAFALLCGGAAVYRLLPVRRVPPNIVFVLIDTLRADRLGTYGRNLHLAPFLDSLGARSLVFDRAYAPSSWTVPSVVSLFVGQRPFEHGVADFLIRLPKEQVTLAEVLSAHGYDTAAILGSSLMAGNPSFGQGFDEYRLVGNQHPRIGETPDATEVNAAAGEWLDRRTRRGPFFLYLHYMEPHWPYQAHEGITPVPSNSIRRDETIGLLAVNGNVVADAAARARVWTFSKAELGRLHDLYDGEVKYLDGRLRELFEELDRRGAVANTIVVITADHGEELGEHGIFGHGNSLYDAGIHVPLIVHLPGSQPGHVLQPVETAGIAPALLRAAGIEPPRTFQVAEIPLRADASAPASDDGPSPVSQLAQVKGFAVWLHRTAVIDGERKLLVGNNGGLSFYDLRTDGDELRPLPPTAIETARAAALDRFDAFTARRDTPPAMDEATLARLRALGYAGAP